MDIQALLEVAALQTRLGAALQAAVQAQMAGDVSDQVKAHLEVTSAAEVLIEALALLGPDAPLDPASQANIAIQHLSMAVDHLFNLDRREAAEAADARATAIAERWSDEPARTRLQLDQATRRRERGQFAAALATYAKVRDEARAAGATEVAYQAAIKRAETLQWLGDASRALDELEAIRPTAPTGLPAEPSLDPMIGLMQNMQALVAARASDTDYHFFRFLCLRDLAGSDPPKLDDAAAELGAVAPTYRDMGLAAAVSFYEADLALRAGKADQALAVSSSLVEAFRNDQRLTHKTGAVLAIKGRALLQLDRAAEAHDAAVAATSALISAGQEENVWRAHQLVAEVAQRQNDVGARRAALAAGTAAVDRMRLAPLGWRLDNLYLQPRLPLYQDAIALAGMEGDGSTALKLIEAVKSRALTAIIGSGRAVAADADPELVRQHDSLDDAIARTQAAAISGGAEPGVDAKLQELRGQRAALAERIRFADPRWQVLTAPETPSAEAISAAAKELDAVAVDLHLDGSRLTAVVVDDSGITVAQQTLAAETVNALHRMLSGLSPPPLDDGTIREPNPMIKDPARLGISLADLLPAEIAARVTAGRRALIAAHGALHLLAWPAVPVAPGEARLIVRTEVGLLPNLACLPALAARPVSTARCAVIGAPMREFGPSWARTLPAAALGTGTEVGALYAARGRLIEPPANGRTATVAAFGGLCANTAAENAILHVTCHGLPPRSEPGDAALLLADADLEAAAISNDGIPFAEVVLTACSTGFRPTTEAQGIPLSGDDALGLPGAFLEAGASTMLVSIPLAQADAAHRMALGYHAARLDELPPLAAFRRAQLALLADPSIRSFNACGFVVYGCR